MFQLSPRFLISPRFLALPVIALTVIVALSQTSVRSNPGATDVSSQRVYRAVNCSDPAKAVTAVCAVARDGTRTVR